MAEVEFRHSSTKHDHDHDHDQRTIHYDCGDTSEHYGCAGYHHSDTDCLAATDSYESPAQPSGSPAWHSSHKRVSG